MTGLCSDERGLIWEYIDADESDFLYEEIFIDDVYFKHEIGFPIHNDQTTVSLVDVGANIGLLSLAAIRKLLQQEQNGQNVDRYMKIIAIEPIPPIFDVLSRNLMHNKGLNDLVCVLNVAIGNSDEESSI